MVWWARLESFFTEFAMLGRAKDDADKKAKAMFLCGVEYRAMSELLTPSPVIFPLCDEHAHAQGSLPFFIRGIQNVACGSKLL